MKSFALLILYATLARAGEARYETRTITNGIADIEISDFETGQIVYLDGNKTGIFYHVLKDNQTLWNISGSPTEGTIIRGPATFRTIATPNTNNPPPYNYSCMTVRITPEIFSANQTAILPPGTNQVAVTLETSTNLLSWTAATNGIYGSPDTARFFRIHLSTPP